ncbi:MAG: NuoF family protein [Planctomycetota bacterium]|nr:NuoF family protein [Planctomycetota bacterium]
MPKFTPAELDAHRAKLAAAPRKRAIIKVGLNTCGDAAGALPVYQAAKEALQASGLDAQLVRTGCAGMCGLEPLVEVQVGSDPAVMYGRVNAEAMREIVAQHVGQGKAVDAYRVPSIADMCCEPPTPGKQYRIVLRNCGVIDPESLDDYIARDGYQALKQVLTQMTPEQVIAELEASGLRGRGGAGFPTFLKWKITRASRPGEQKYIICNGDEGDPGAYMDRSVLEGDPHSVIEGMIIGGWVIGASKGIFYIRAEYPLAVERIEKAIRQARAAGLLGSNILGSGFDFDLEVRLGAGAFVCGEETALMASIEGKRGTPWPRPPYPAQKGLWGQPSMINNVETFANIPPIILRGGAWFGAIGIGRSKGTKVFAVTGKVKVSGLVEIPMGTTLRQVVEGICGGTPSGKPVKAVQTGGPSGGLIPASLLDTPISYEELAKLGSIMGSGGMIVMDETDNTVELSRFYLDFSVDESCGKCAPCRIGGTQMLRVIDRVLAGKGTKQDIATIKRIALTMQRGSLCALGQTTPNPVLSSLKYFEHEWNERLVASK